MSNTQAGPDRKPGQTSLASWCRRAALRLKILSTPGTRMLTDMGMTDGGVGHLPGERTQVRAMQGLAKRCARPDHVGNLLLGNRRAPTAHNVLCRALPGSHMHMHCQDTSKSCRVFPAWHFMHHAMTACAKAQPSFSSVSCCCSIMWLLVSCSPLLRRTCMQPSPASASATARTRGSIGGSERPSRPPAPCWPAGRHHKHQPAAASRSG